jgi:cell division protein FtsW
MVYSASSFEAFETHRDPYFFLKGHLIRLSMGLLLFVLAYRVDYHHLRRWSIVPLIISLGLLTYVLFTGSGVNRWITVGGVTLQPSEFARIALVVYLADWCSRNTNRLRRPWDGFLFCLVMIVATAGLVMIEPSYSAAVMILVCGVALLVMAGARWLHLFASVLPVVPLAIYMAIKAPYRLERVLNFINPLADPQGAGYQSIQSKIAVGSGQIWGFGIGMSGQKFYFLPEAHCDFIFSILCEETGFIGAIAVLSLFTLFFWRGIRIAVRSRDQFGFLLTGGLLFSIILFAIVNIGVVLGFLPVTGLPLPFISYGGSALIANLIACGIILNVSRHTVSPESI